MKIVSKFKDYYDSVGAKDRDPVPFYDRTTKEINVYESERSSELNAIKPVTNLMRMMPPSSFSRRGVLAFCGALYPFYTGGDRYYWDCEKIMPREDKHKYRLNKKSWQKFLVDSSGLAALDASMWIYFKTPVFLLLEEGGWSHSRNSFFLNPRLYKLNFAKKVNPYTAYQEIDMFLGNNMATQEDPNANVTDALKAHYTGHDGKYSFKTPPRQ